MSGLSYSVLLLLLLVYSSLQLVFKLDTSPICMQFPGGSKSTFMYIVSGVDNGNIKVRVSQNGKILFQKQQIKDFEDTRQYTQGNVQICFESTDTNDKQIAFDFFLTENPVKAVIEKKDLFAVSHALKQTKEQMEKISINQQFHIERDQIHKIMLEESQSHIKWTGATKIIFLLSSALVQLWIMKSFFKNSSKSYVPVQMA